MSWRSHLMVAAGLLVAVGAATNGNAKPAAVLWTVVRTPNFTVLTQGKAGPAQEWARDLERFRAALGRLVPVEQARLRPVVMVIFPNGKAFQPYVMLQKGKPAEIAGFFSREDGICAIGLAVGYGSKETRRVIFHEATHWFYSARAERLPPWLEEGIAEVFSTFRTDQKNFTVGEPIVSHLRFLSDHGLDPVSKLLGTARTDIDYHDSDQTGQFYAQSWFLVHWAMFGRGSPGAGSLSRYLAGLKTSRSAGAAFTAAFGGDDKTIDRRLADDLEAGEYNSPSYALPADLPPIDPPRPAAEGEIEYALGALQLGGRGAAAALPHLAQAVQLDPQNVSAWEALGFAQLMQDNKEAALAAFDRAAGLGSRHALVWQNRATLRRQAQSPVGGFGGTPDRELFDQSARDDRRAIELDPRCHSAYADLACLVGVTQPADAGDLPRLEQGQKFYPEDDLIAAGVATARLRVGDRAAATKELRAVVASQHATAAARQLAGSALENEVLARFNARFEPAQRRKDYAEAIAAIDEATSGDLLTAQNLRSLAAARRQLDQMRRLENAAELANHDRVAEAVAAIQTVLDEPPATDFVRREAERLMKQCRGN